MNAKWEQRHFVISTLANLVRSRESQPIFLESNESLPPLRTGEGATR